MNFYKDIYTKRWINIEKVNQIWKVLVEDFFQPMIPYESKVLDVGCGFCYFINHLQVLNEALCVAGFEVEKKIVRFLAYTTRSKLPQHPLLIKFYLKFRPLWLILGKQSLFIGVKLANQGCSLDDFSSSI